MFFEMLSILSSLWGVGPVVYAAGLSIRYLTGSNPVHPAIFSGVLSVAATRQNVTLQFRVQLSEDTPTSSTLAWHRDDCTSLLMTDTTPRVRVPQPVPKRTRMGSRHLGGSLEHRASRPSRVLFGDISCRRPPPHHQPQTHPPLRSPRSLHVGNPKPPCREKRPSV